MSAGRVIEIYKETGLPEEFARAFALEDFRGTHALGHTRMATESRVTTEGSHPFSTGLRPLPRPQRLALEPQPAPREPASRGHRVPDRERHRGRRRLPRLAPPRGREPRAGARGLPRRPRRLLHLRGRDGRRVRRASRPDRLQARRARRDRRLGRDVAPSGGRSPCFPARPTRARGSPSRASSTPGRRRSSDGRRRARARGRRGRRPRDDVAARAEPAPARPRSGGPGPAALPHRQPERRARRRVRSRRRDRGRDRRARGLLLRRDEQARDRARARKREHGHRREHDVRAASRSTGTSASRRVRRGAAGCSSFAATPRRAAGSR